MSDSSWNADRHATFGGKSANALPGNLTDIICISGDESHYFATHCNYCVQCHVCTCNKTNRRILTWLSVFGEGEQLCA
ncbi:hypothetical protein WN51_06804 [Melipona quadrifasciata]|uniref:Uncharacterized protein n=1 Tax=Melipona quadrifasciata TaxID=166423 RepID=A0A0N0U3L6_9HYME|nr:hypothetical protein WN51_06804 [Melipona quadrifasciata]